MSMLWEDAVQELAGEWRYEVFVNDENFDLMRDCEPRRGGEGGGDGIF